MNAPKATIQVVFGAFFMLKLSSLKQIGSM